VTDLDPSPVITAADLPSSATMATPCHRTHCGADCRPPEAERPPNASLAPALPRVDRQICGPLHTGAPQRRHRSEGGGGRPPPPSLWATWVVSVTRSDDSAVSVGTLQTGYPYAQDLSRVPRRQTLPPGTEGLWCHHVSRCARLRLPVWEGSEVTTCPTASNPTFRHGMAPASSRVLWCQTPPPDTEGLWCRYVSRGARPHLLLREGSDVTTCHVAPGPPPDEGGLWCHHVSHGFRPASRHGRALASPCVTRRQILPPSTGGLRRRHVPHGSRRAMGHIQKRNTQSV
jgi:hypothetical protein